MDIKPITLEGRNVHLAPMTADFFEELCRVGLNESLWKYSPTFVRTREDMRRYVETTLNPNTFYSATRSNNWDVSE